jgi:hypothetical protein
MKIFCIVTLFVLNLSAMEPTQKSLKDIIICSEQLLQLETALKTNDLNTIKIIYSDMRNTIQDQRKLEAFNHQILVRQTDKIEALKKKITSHKICKYISQSMILTAGVASMVSGSICLGNAVHDDNYNFAIASSTIFATGCLWGGGLYIVSKTFSNTINKLTSHLCKSEQVKEIMCSMVFK